MADVDFDQLEAVLEGRGGSRPESRDRHERGGGEGFCCRTA